MVCCEHKKGKKGPFSKSGIVEVRIELVLWREG